MKKTRSFNSSVRIEINCSIYRNRWTNTYSIWKQNTKNYYHLMDYEMKLSLRLKQ